MRVCNLEGFGGYEVAVEWQGGGLRGARDGVVVEREAAGALNGRMVVGSDGLVVVSLT